MEMSMDGVWVLLFVLGSSQSPSSPAAVAAEFTTEQRCEDAGKALRTATGTVVNNGSAALDTKRLNQRFDVTYVCVKK
jgi:hypothetical protein